MASFGAGLREGEAALSPLADPEERCVLFAALDSLSMDDDLASERVIEDMLLTRTELWAIYLTIAPLPSRQYRRAAHLNVTHRRRQNLYSLPSSQLQLLAEPPFSLLKNLSRVDDAIDCNADIADAILECGLQAYRLPREPEPGQLTHWQGWARSDDLDKAHSTIRQFYRDWSAEGAEERKLSHDYVLAQLRRLPQSTTTLPPHASRPKVLVPGAGLGRLLYELCRDGYDVEGNEISYLQLLASNWVLNHAESTSLPLYPFVTQFTNLFSREQQLRKVMIPDLRPGEDTKQALFRGETVGAMKMTAADFVVLYSREEYRATFDAVVTVFFIDTAPNFLRYVDAVVNCLKTHGMWINLGPLLWHSGMSCGAKRTSGEEEPGHEAGARDPGEDVGIGEPGSFELTEEEVIWLLEKRGLQLEQRGVSTDGVGYIQDPESMLQHKYRVSCWTVVKEASAK